MGSGDAVFLDGAYRLPGTPRQFVPVRRLVNAYEDAANSHLSDLIQACRRVPLLDAYPVGEGKICLVLDGRLGLELSEADACAVIPFIADCINIAGRTGDQAEQEPRSAGH
jgi:hypothetical protein